LGSQPSHRRPIVRCRRCSAPRRTDRRPHPPGRHIPVGDTRLWIEEEGAGEGDGSSFGLPRMIGGQIRSLVAWSRIFDGHEILVAINADYHGATTAWVTIDGALHQDGTMLRCIYSSDAAQIGSGVEVEPRNGRAVRLTVPAAGCVIYE
jgi:hypothetical protein